MNQLNLKPLTIITNITKLLLIIKILFNKELLTIKLHEKNLY